MALDRQKILSELGSVMNQLQSADCGCMGKLFGNGTSPAPSVSSPITSGGYNHGCHCHHNHFHGSCSGEPCQAMPVQHMNHSCMGRCNPAKLYNDTYQYLNNNLMQPVVQEVYNDLKTITPANTVMNNQPLNASQGHTNMQLMNNNERLNPEKSPNPYHNKMPNLDPRVAGMGRGNIGYSGGMRGAENQINEMGGPMGGVSYYMNSAGGHASGAGSGQLNVPGGQIGGSGEDFRGAGGQLSGMGANIVNMMMGGNKPATTGQPTEGRSLTQPMVLDAPQSPHGQIGLTPIPAQMSPHKTIDRPQHPTNHNLNNYQRNLNTPNQNESHAPNLRQPVQGMAPNHNAYGQHAQGIAKFNEMFPGVMNNFGGDLNFDPMAIAVQMNPANHQPSAMEAMQKVMNGNNTGINKMLNQSNAEPPLNISSPVDAPNPSSNVTPNQSIPHNNPPNTNAGQSSGNLTQKNYEENQGQLDHPYGTEQQVYTATGQPLLEQQIQGNDEQILQQISPPVDPNANTHTAPTQHHSPNDGHMMNSPNFQAKHLIPESRPLSELNPIREQSYMEKEPIFPANVSHNQSYSHMKRPSTYTYNTLGQPVQMLPAKNYHMKDPGGPQTLSPQNIPSKSIHDPKMYSNVKSTVSKTSIMGNRPVGRNPSKNQLQNIYNQYKGSQSVTQQNLLGRTEGVSHSEGMLKVPQQRAERNDPNQQVLIEKVGGDTLAENEPNKEVAKKQIVGGQNGDMGNIDKIQNNAISEQPNPTMTAKTRNGLQDIVYTSYPSSAAWTFHGRSRPAYPISPRRAQY